MTFEDNLGGVSHFYKLNCATSTFTITWKWDKDALLLALQIVNKVVVFILFRHKNTILY